ncbi:DnaJ domain-containing protein (plasmid) [Rubrobacter marinus]|uniref:DnaJ domain-containing protein n=1 Tax=Rubrobacter marinus TaxID=2653852 RepID=A0A6G8Q3E7_9ACTN|nr:J domain-containing protein [Rubrobacter marinus]QIN80950.1 DnaJ domain-containing protein [Rubrobacter marinus]
MATTDLYGVLGLSRGALQDEIRRSYRRLAREYHPDANLEDPRAEERFKEVQHAYSILSDPKSVAITTTACSATPARSQRHGGALLRPRRSP